MTGTSKASLKDQILDWLLEKIPVNACAVNHPIPAKNKEIKNATSLDSAEIRGISAYSIIRSTGAAYTTSGRDCKVTYSDGGSETIKFNYRQTTQVASNKAYVAGNGVSKCPIP